MRVNIHLTHWGRDKMAAIFRCIFLNENVWIFITISLIFFPKGRINNIPALVQIMAWRRRGDKPLSESMMISLPTHICVTRPQWVKKIDIVSIKRSGIIHTKCRLAVVNFKDHHGYGLSQWDATLQCNVASHGLYPNPEWSLKLWLSNMNTSENQSYRKAIKSSASTGSLAFYLWGPPPEKQIHVLVKQMCD